MRLREFAENVHTALAEGFLRWGRQHFFQGADGEVNTNTGEPKLAFVPLDLNQHAQDVLANTTHACLTGAAALTAVSLGLPVHVRYPNNDTYACKWGNETVEAYIKLLGDVLADRFPREWENTVNDPFEQDDYTGRVAYMNDNVLTWDDVLDVVKEAVVRAPLD